MKQIQKRKNVIFILLTIYMFTVLFAPPILPYMNILISAFSFFVIIIRYKDSLMKEYIHKIFIKIILAWCFIIALWILIFLINFLFYKDVVQIEHYITMFNRITMLALVLSTNVTFICYEIKKYQFNKKEIFKMIIYAGIIESTLCIISYFSPFIKEIFIKLMLMNTGDELYTNQWYITVRSFGFASTLVDYFGFGISIIASICFAYGILFDIKYIFYSFYIFIATVLNSRSGILLYGFFIMVVLIYWLYKEKNIKKAMILISTLIFLFIVLMILISRNEATSMWIKDGFESIFELIFNQTGSKDVGEVVSSNKFWFLPDGFRLFIGTGHSRFQAVGYPHTDNGYVNDIWLFGIVGCFIIYGKIYMNILSCWKKTKDKFLQMILLILFFAFAIFNFKAYVLSGSLGGITYFFILSLVNYFITNENIEKESNIKELNI